MRTLFDTSGIIFMTGVFCRFDGSVLILFCFVKIRWIFLRLWRLLYFIFYLLKDSLQCLWCLPRILAEFVYKLLLNTGSHIGLKILILLQYNLLDHMWVWIWRLFMIWLYTASSKAVLTLALIILSIHSFIYSFIHSFIREDSCVFIEHLKTRTSHSQCLNFSVILNYFLIRVLVTF